MDRRKRRPTCDKPYVHNEEDTYLTLEVLADILEEISAEAGKSAPRSNVCGCASFVRASNNSCIK